MKTIKYLSLVGMSLCIIGCSKLSKTYKLDIISNSCTYVGLKDNYGFNEKANIIFDVEEDFYHPLTKSNFTIYGADDFEFDTETSTLSVNMNTNIGIKVAPTPLVGLEKTYYDACLWTLNHYDDHKPYTYNKIKYSWNIDPSGNELTYTKLCLTEAFAELGIIFEDEFQFSGTQIVDKDGSNEPIKLDQNNNRITPMDNDKAFLTEDSAVLDLHSAVSIETKNMHIEGHAIMHLNNASSATYVKLDLKPGDFTYKYWKLHAPSTIEVTYISE